MLESVLSYLNNWFVRYTYSGNVTVDEGGAVLAPSEAAAVLQPGRWYRILDSDFYDGVYQVPEEEEPGEEAEEEEEPEEPEEEEQGETFCCTLWTLGVPAGLLSIVKDMETWQAKYGDTVSAPYQSESFGGYSYSKSGSSSSSGGTATVWTQFADALAPYKRPPMARVVSASGQSYQDVPYRRPFNTDFRR